MYHNEVPWIIENSIAVVLLLLFGLRSMGETDLEREMSSRSHSVLIGLYIFN